MNPQPIIQEPVIRTREKKVALVTLLAFYFLNGFGDYFVRLNFPEYSVPQKIYMLGGMVIGIVLIMRWFVLDAAEHRYQFSKRMFLWMVVLTIAAAPVYFFHTRGKQAWKQILKVLLFLLLCLVGIGLGQTAAYFAAVIWVRWF